MRVRLNWNFYERMLKPLNVSFEKAVRLLVGQMPISEESSRKPILFHDIRVGVYLYERGYSRDIVLAGVLHDALEWSSISQEMLRDGFGESVLALVLASTRDNSIPDGTEKTQELIQRCIQNGQEALIVKTADILDSFKWYSSQDDIGQLRYCLRNAQAILSGKPREFADPIFEELRVWRNTFAHLVA